MFEIKMRLFRLEEGEDYEDYKNWIAKLPNFRRFIDANTEFRVVKSLQSSESG